MNQETANLHWNPAPPTRFTAVDELCCYYDSPAEPNTVHLEVRLPGQLDYPQLRRAVAGALAEQPRARARRAPGGLLRLRYTWQYPPRPDADPVSRQTWADERQLAALRQAFLAASPPLDAAPPVRLLLAGGPVGDCLILSAHHAALDGLSCLSLLRRIDELYRGHAERPARTISAVRAAQADRGQASLAPVRRNVSLAPALARPARIAAAAPGRRDGCGLQVLTLAELPTAAAGPGRRATVNDLLIAAAILAVGRWNAGRRRPVRPVRISMPLNARPPGRDDAAGNLSRIVTISADPPTEGPAADRLLLQVAAQTSAAKQAAGPQVGAGSRLLAAAPLPAAVKRRVVRALLRIVGPVRCDTSMVTNLGRVSDPPRFGQAGPVLLAFSSSAHMPRGLSIGAVAADGRLQLTFRYRYALLDDAAAASFAAGYVAALNELSGQSVASGAGQRAAALADDREGPR